MVDMMVDLWWDQELRFLAEIGILPLVVVKQQVGDDVPIGWQVRFDEPPISIAVGKLRKNNLWSRQCALAKADVFLIA